MMVLNGTGGWIFTEVDSVFAPTAHANSSWADFDDDQDLDLLLVNMVPNSMKVLFIDTEMTVMEHLYGEDILGTLTVEHGEAQWGDYDGDGDLDILVAGNLKRKLTAHTLHGTSNLSK